jgi:hypothetical protein
MPSGPVPQPRNDKATRASDWVERHIVTCRQIRGFGVRGLVDRGKGSSLYQVDSQGSQERVF